MPPKYGPVISPMRTIPALLGAAALLWAGIAAGDEPLHGTFALQGGSPKTSAYLVNGQKGSDELSRRLDLWLTPAGLNAAITSYDVDMTKMLHAVIIGDDFRSFAHVHPQLEPGGHFVSEQRFAHRGLYHLYSDGEPSGLGQQVFRFDLQAGQPVPGTPIARDLSERRPAADVDGYTVTLSGLHLEAGAETMLAVRISRDGKPAGDLHPYLGSLAHAVFIDADDLTYVHVHPVPLGASSDGGDAGGMQGMKGMGGMEMDDAPSAPAMALHVRVLEPGTYKLWLQFAGGSSLHVAAFVLTAS
jgi:hypothetical protein